MLFKLSNLNSNIALTLGYLNRALNNSALKNCFLVLLFIYVLESLESNWLTYNAHASAVADPDL